MSKFESFREDIRDEEVNSKQSVQDVSTLPKVVDNRSLYEKLQEQKAAKEEAINEANKFSNLIRRLDNDEIDFLAGVHEQKEAEEARRRTERLEAIEDFRKAQAAVDTLSRNDTAPRVITETTNKRKAPIGVRKIQKNKKKVMAQPDETINESGKRCSSIGTKPSLIAYDSQSDS